jgi:hypothetical protein
MAQSTSVPPCRLIGVPIASPDPQIPLLLNSTRAASNVDLSTLLKDRRIVSHQVSLS